MNNALSDKILVFILNDEVIYQQLVTDVGAQGQQLADFIRTVELKDGEHTLQVQAIEGETVVAHMEFLLKTPKQTTLGDHLLVKVFDQLDAMQNALNLFTQLKMLHDAMYPIVRGGIK